MTLTRRIAATLRRRGDLYHLWRLAFPIMIGFVSFNVVGLVDTAMVATLGIDALAAVGLAQIMAANCAALLLGLGAGVLAVVARHRGEEHRDGMLMGLSGGVAVGLIVASLLLLTLYPAVPALLTALNDDANVVALSVPYLEWRLLSLPVMAVTVAFGAFWNALGKSTYYMTAILVMNATNVLLNYMLIFGHWGAPAMGVAGAALATALAMALSALVHIALYRRFTRRLPRRWITPAAPILRRTVRLSVPASLRALQDAAALALTIWIIGQIGSREVGIVNVLFTILAVAVLPAMALGTAAGSLVGRSLGQGDPAQARRWGWLAVFLGGVVSVPLALPMLLCPGLLLAGFIDDPVIRLLAETPTRITGLGVVLINTGYILSNALYGAGESARVLRAALAVQWLLIAPAMLAWGLWLQGGFIGLWTLFILVKSLLYALVLTQTWYRSFRGHSVRGASVVGGVDDDHGRSR